MPVPRKALKGFLTWHSRIFGKTYDIRALGAPALEIDPTLKDLVRRASLLTDYAWRFRYPGNPKDQTQQEAVETLTLAREVCDAVLARLPTEVGP